MSPETKRKVGLKIYSADAFTAVGLTAPDVYFTPGYGRAEQANGAGEWVSVVAFEGMWQMPLHVRSGDAGMDAVSPYGYSGVFASPQLTRSDHRSAWIRAQEELRARGILSVFLRQSPLVASPFVTAPGEVVVDGHATVRVPTRCLDSAWQAMEGRSRTSIRKADRDGFQSGVRPARTEDLIHGPFRALYEESMRRRSAGERYFFADAYYLALHRALGQNLLIGTTRDTTGRYVAAALFMRHGETLHYHLSGSEPDAGRAGATNQLVWNAMQWASHHGVDAIHLGGGVTNRDSLFKFKRSFGGEALAFDAFGVVLDEGAYEAAVEVRARQLGVPASMLSESGYFPKFRVSA